MINRVEIIDWTKLLEDGGGRTVLVSPNEYKLVTYELQDDGKTLKIFVASPPEPKGD